MIVAIRYGIWPSGDTAMKMVQIKLQTVTTIDFDLEFDSQSRKAMTLGQQIDALIRHNIANGQIPNKLVVDLNPPTPVNPADVGDDLSPVSIDD